MRINKTRHGATIIEFALVAFIFFLVMWGIFEFGRAFYVVNTAQHLTRCIARTAVVSLPSQHEAAKMQCLMPFGGSGTTWPFFSLAGDDLTRAFRLQYVVKTVTDTGPVVDTVDDRDVTNTSVPDDQITACVQQTNCVTNVIAYFDSASYRVQTFGLLAAWIRLDSSYQSFTATTTMPAESMTIDWTP